MPRTTFRSLTAQRSESPQPPIAFAAHAKKKRCATVRKRQPLLRRRSPRPFPFLSRLFESRPRALFSLHLTTPFGTPAPRLFSPRSALLSSFIALVPHASGNLSRASAPPRLRVSSCRTSRASFLQVPPPTTFPDECSRSAGPRPPHFRSSPPSRFLLCLPSPVLPCLRAQKKAGERPRPVVFCKTQSHTSMTDVPRRTSST